MAVRRATGFVLAVAGAAGVDALKLKPSRPPMVRKATSGVHLGAAGPTYMHDVGAIAMGRMPSVGRGLTGEQSQRRPASGLLTGSAGSSARMSEFAPSRMVFERESATPGLRGAQSANRQLRPQGTVSANIRRYQGDIRYDDAIHSKGEAWADVTSEPDSELRRDRRGRKARVEPATKPKERRPAAAAADDHIKEKQAYVDGLNDYLSLTAERHVVEDTVTVMPPTKSSLPVSRESSRPSSAAGSVTSSSGASRLSKASTTSGGSVYGRAYRSSMLNGGPYDSIRRRPLDREEDKHLYGHLLKTPDLRKNRFE